MKYISLVIFSLCNATFEQVFSQLKCLQTYQKCFETEKDANDFLLLTPTMKYAAVAYALPLVVLNDDMDLDQLRSAIESAKRIFNTTEDKISEPKSNFVPYEPCNTCEIEMQDVEEFPEVDRKSYIFGSFLKNRHPFGILDRFRSAKREQIKIDATYEGNREWILSVLQSAEKDLESLYEQIKKTDIVLCMKQRIELALSYEMSRYYDSNDIHVALSSFWEKIHGSVDKFVFDPKESKAQSILMGAVKYFYSSRKELKQTETCSKSFQIDYFLTKTVTQNECTISCSKTLSYA